ncbi:MAG TPA: hypothetical protein VFN03_13085 [Trueperaceae bacterium]|nr:hypothetical protein [Trueperaceae bacterium]
MTTPRALLLAVTRSGQPAVLNTALFSAVTVGNDVLAWWDGDGAAKALAPEQ